MSALNIKQQALAVAVVSLLSIPQSEAITSKVAAGQLFGLFIQNGTVYGTGSTFNGEIGATPGDAPYTNMDNREYTPVNIGVINAKSVAASAYEAVALKTNGLAYWWGRDLSTSKPSLRPNLIPLTNLLDVAVSNKNVIMIKDSGNGTSGKVYIWDFASNTTPTLVTGLPTDIVAIAAGNSHFIAQDSLGNVYTWGANNTYGQLGRTTSTPNVADIVPGVTQVKGISAGGNSVIVVHQDGTITGWGYSNYGQVGNGQALSAAPQYVAVPTKSPLFSDVKTAVIGTSAALITTNSGASYGIGWHNYINGAIYNVSSTAPALIRELSNVEYTAIGGAGFILTVNTDNQFNNWGQAGAVGTGTTVETHAPRGVTFTGTESALWIDPDQVELGLIAQCDAMDSTNPLYTSLCGTAPIVQLNDQATTCTATLTAERASITTLNDAISVLTQTKTDLNTANTTLTTTNTDLQSQVTNLTTQNATLQQQNTDLQQQIATLIAEKQALALQVANADDGNNGHGNDVGKFDDSNPGKSKRK